MKRSPHLKSVIQGLLLSVSLVSPTALVCQTLAASRPDNAAQQIELATLEVQRIKDLVDRGLEAPIRLVQAELDLADAQDAAILERTRSAGPAEPSAESELDILAAAQRRIDREKERIEQRKQLIAGGLVTLSDLSSFEEELSRRQLDLYWAQSHAQFRTQAESARLRSSITAALEAKPLEYEDFSADGMEHYDGGGVFDVARDLRPLALAFEAQFGRELPISADGETDFHRALGFDHRGRIDVAVHPRDADGVWLRHYLQMRKIPYYAFTNAIPGKASAAHIHIGAGSTRLPYGD